MKTTPLRTESAIDLELVGKIQEDLDEASFNKLMLRYASKMHTVIYGMVKNREDTEDIWQEVMVQVWKKINSFKGNSSFYTWLYSVTHNISLNWLKKAANRHRRREFSILDLPGSETSLDPADYIPSLRCRESASSFDFNLVSSLIAEARETVLNKDQRTVLDLLGTGMKVKAVGLLLKIPEGTVRSMRFYGREKILGFLSNRLGPDWQLILMSCRSGMRCN